MKSVGGAERSSREVQEEMLRAAMHVASQLDTLEHSSAEAVDDGVLHAARHLPRQCSLTHTTRQRGDDLGHHQIGHEEVVPSSDNPIELLAAGLGQVEFDEGAGVAVEGAGQRGPVRGALLAEPRRSAPPTRDDPRVPR